MGDSALVRITPQKEVCVEKFSEFQSLGRIAIRDNKNTIGIGIVTEVQYL
jgi:translation elongation factor EF-1alpha